MKKANPVIPMRKFKKHEKGALYVGYKQGSSSHLHTGILVRGYYSINGIFKNAAWVLKCGDGKERSYQFIKKIKPEQVEEIRKQRKSYIGKA